MNNSNKNHPWIQIDERCQNSKELIEKSKNFPREEEKLATCQGMKIKLVSDFPVATGNSKRQGGKAFKVLMEIDCGP